MTGQVWAALDDRQLELGPAKAAKRRFPHWRLERDGSKIAWLVLDQEDSSVNTLSEAVLRGLDEALAEIEKTKPRGVVLRSAKDSGFCVGADVTEFGKLTDPEEVEKRIAQGREIIDRLAGLSMPTVAVIHGQCLGGGLELALACDLRIAVDGAKLGFPEVKLGLHPGLGGTVRSTQLINPVEAMTLMLTGKSAHTKKAKSLGLVDVVTQERHVKNAVKAAVAGDVKGARQGLVGISLTSAPLRAAAARRMRSKTAEKARAEHYPAPYALIDLWEKHGGSPEAMKDAETESFAKLLVSDTAKNLLRVFFLREKLKKLARGEEEIRHVHVVGAGAMGGDIAAWCARKGLRATLNDAKAEMIAGAMKRAKALAKSEHLDGPQTRDMLDRLIPDPDNLGVRHADLVIEAVPEKPDLKKKVYEELEPQMKAKAVLATNTSSIPLDTLRQSLKKPGRLIGLHFFNPVAKMQLVEVVSHDAANKASLARGRAFLGLIDRLPAPVTSSPGFLVNRALMPYLLEAILMMEEGAAPETIDRAAEEFGMPMGPIELADQVGLDIALDVAENLKERLDEPFPDIPERIRKLVDKGDLGAKSGKGFYSWSDGDAKKGSAEEPPEGMADRLILPLLNACVWCLRHGVVDEEELVDASMIFGTGFAPFRGGPLHYARQRGVDAVVETLKSLAKEHGDRLAPDEGWQALR